MIKAVFFDRDNTLTYKNQKVIDRYYVLVESVSNRPYKEDKKKMFEMFSKIKAQGFNTNTYDNEVLFYKEYYKQVLFEECGYHSPEIDNIAEEIFKTMWLKDRVLYDDVISTFKEIKTKGIKIGIISDTTHSLKQTLVSLGLEEYIDSYTCSKEVGIMKPNPLIYLTALKKLDIKPEECLYIDDYEEEEVVGAESLGIKSFRINRNGEEFLHHDIKSLGEILKFL